MKKPGTQVRIRSAADLFDGLRHREASVRLPTLAAVAAQPQLVLAYGPHQGVDVIQELCDQLERDAGMFSKVILGALVAFRDERVVEACCRLLESGPDGELLGLACQRLADDDSEVARACLRKLLFSEVSARATEAARCLRAHPDLELEEKIRVHLWVRLEDEAISQPAAHSIWLQLLDGPLQARARLCLEEQGLQAFEWLTQVLPINSWLLEWGARCFPEQAECLLEQALETELAGLALELSAKHPNGFPALREAARGFLQHHDHVWRESAWRVARLDPDFGWQEAWLKEQSAGVRLALAARIAAECQEESPILLLAESDDWRLRALAAQGLVRLQARESARRLARSTAEGVRTVGASVLLALEDYEWMEEHLM